MSVRIDVGRMGSSRVDHNGNLIVTGALTRTGVFSYRHTDGTKTRELRHPKDVFDAPSVASFIQVPVTDEHPTDGRVTPDNVDRYMVGNVGDTITPDGNLLKATIMVRKADTIAKITGDAGKPKRELSCGYTADVVPETGMYKGEKYDHRQTNIRGNHVALVRAGRAGPEARLLMDAADGCMEDVAWSEEQDNILDAGNDSGDNILDAGNDSGDNIETDNGGKRVKIYKDGVTLGTGDSEFKVDKLELNVPDEAVESLNQVFAQRDLVLDELRATRTKLDEAQGECSALREQKKDWEDPARIAKAAQEISKVTLAAQHQGFKEDELDGKSTDEIKRMVVARQWPNLYTDSLSEDHISGQFLIIQDDIKSESKNLESMATLGDAANPRQDGTDYGNEDEEKSYRQLAEAKLDGLHAKSIKQMREDKLV